MFRDSLLCSLIYFCSYFCILSALAIMTNQYHHVENIGIDHNHNVRTMNLYTFRLKPGEDLKRGIGNYVSKHNLRAVTIVSCVGSLRQVNLRLASQRNGSMAYLFREREMFEIVSLVGTFESYDDKPSYGHLHMSLSDSVGNVIGGHVMKGCIVFTTAEITLIENINLQFRRVWDKSTGYGELQIEERSITKSIVVPSESPLSETTHKVNNWRKKLLSSFLDVVTHLDILESKHDLDDIWNI